MKKIIKIILILAIISAALTLFSSCKKSFSDSFTLWEGDGLRIAGLGGSASITLNGAEYDCVCGYKGNELYFMDKEGYKALLPGEFNLSICICYAEFYVKNDKLYLTVTRDFLFERGESQVDNTGARFVADRFPLKVSYDTSPDLSSSANDGQEQTETSSDGEKE